MVEQALRDEAVDGIVVDHQHPHPRGERTHRGRRRLGLSGLDQRQQAGESAALARFRLDRQRAAHVGGQLTRERQAQARALEPTGVCVVGLSEALEEPQLVLGRDANAAVVDHAAQLLAATLHLDAHRAVLGELDGVVDQISQHLTQPQPIEANRRGQLRPKRHGEVELLAAGQRRPQGAQLIGERAERERPLVQHQAPGLEL